MKLYTRNTLLGIISGLTIAGSVHADSGESDIIQKYRELIPSIVGGEEAYPGEFPFMVSLQAKGGGHFCGASLVGDYYALTASHCTEGESASQLQVVVGLHEQNDTSSAQTIQVSEIINHPQYDIALLKLTDKANDEYTRISIGDPSDIYDGQMTTVIGWGDLSEGGNSPNALQKVDVPVVSLEECRSAYGNAVHDYNVCAGLKEGGKDSCQGDSGGPLFLNQAGEFRQLGVVSWGDGCARPGKYGVYTSVPAFKDWIASYIGNDDGGDDGDDGDGDGDDSVLTNGQAVTDLSGERGSMTYFVLDVPADAQNLSFVMEGGSGDADLYVKAGSQPTESDYDCRPYKNGNNESCADMDVTPGKYYVMLQGYNAYSGVSLTGSFDGKGDTGGTGSGMEKDLSASGGEWIHFSDTIPDGVEALTVTISGGTGDADLYVLQGQEPSRDAFECRPYKNGNEETCTIERPKGGEWFMSLRGYSSFSGVTLEWNSK
ncbi:serine protease [Hahella sp. CCB-MM4]|uniref:trypsin-like serine protease n=1 Tax=Hahella sp. (strain CCB-MM4) TaxID=1926491 RepID=UPI000B9C6186|nr:trypsin-like serine protease [Hahella sp. CCB-MM4]OZG72632.1 serine protease [Hahella sp. CCB-MM4]